ncbi:2-succinyl-6-hydroxy-2,4-cyclohexadiene-1-carboxylate synthase [Vibrio sp. SM6]|uniref:Putative 2-succinyl-6-hydroxy-2,4-cyclohexadiene-1-carboxylate synthase n=1 Tax=Vibrio agarilyticus TaxID=2726741 RepID=A0A7X8YHS3_9VIBR|nr:2-succinyl-6-hydroxy-2,4-cyclohexadiene-1-carboxylate synthase [Vibrio agarilyticus]NLS13870.1 2-succinyl-6-hydroxy-2,4-cyclohexadiene-1-carboxylate synthase [Vibrio agarilyticus]
MLSYQLVNTEQNRASRPPLLVLVHGLLGCGNDWQSVHEALPSYPTLLVDLPGHGKSVMQSCSSLQDAAMRLYQTIESVYQPLAQRQQVNGVVLIGYSLGARIVLNGLASQQACALSTSLPIIGAIVEGAHTGLANAELRCARWRHDQGWARRFQQEPIAQVLADWYQQPVFSSLNHAQRQTVIAQRSANLGSTVAQMLLATSLATQPNLIGLLQQTRIPIACISGASDVKFTALVQRNQSVANNYCISSSVVDHAGHNVHQAQPKAFSQIVHQHITQFVARVAASSEVGV